jgi:enamine deaminase RidA (YjgF/YER057c/UK114 family)
MGEEPPMELVRPGDLSPGAPYAYAAVTARPVLVFTAGACPLDESGATIGGSDVAAQADHVMDNLERALRGAGAGLPDVVKTTVYVASDDRSDLVAAWDVVRARFGAHDPPATLVGVRVLGYPDQLVEVEAVAELPQWPARS